MRRLIFLMFLLLLGGVVTVFSVFFHIGEQFFAISPPVSIIETSPVSRSMPGQYVLKDEYINNEDVLYSEQFSVVLGNNSSRAGPGPPEKEEIGPNISDLFDVELSPQRVSEERGWMLWLLLVMVLLIIYLMFRIAKKRQEKYDL